MLSPDEKHPQRPGEDDWSGERLGVGAGLGAGKGGRGALIKGSEDPGGKGGAECAELPPPALHYTAALHSGLRGAQGGSSRGTST